MVIIVALCGSTANPATSPAIGASRALGQGDSAVGCAGQMTISRAFRRAAEDLWPYPASVRRAVRRVAGDIRPCPAVAGGSILQGGSEVSSQENLTAAHRRKVGRLYGSGRRARSWS